MEDQLKNQPTQRTNSAEAMLKNTGAGYAEGLMMDAGGGVQQDQILCQMHTPVPCGQHGHLSASKAKVSNRG